MKRITLATVALIAGSMVAAAQEPPTPPTPPARPAPAPRPDSLAPVAPTPRPMPAPRAVPTRDFDYRVDIDTREIARQAEQAAREASRVDQEQIREMAREASRIDQERVREMSRIDAEEIGRQARDAVRDLDFGYAPMVAAPRIAPMAVMSPMPPMPAMAPMAPMAYGGMGRDFTDRLVPAPWVQGDPADSVYRVARDALNGGDYGRAARTFNDLVAKYPKSQLTDAAQYYEALARYKIGTTEELQRAAKILEPLVAKLPVRTSTSENSGQTRVSVNVGGFGSQGCGGFNCGNVSYYKGGFSESEVAALYNRVNGTLAQRGDKSAQAIIEKSATLAGSASCDREDLDVRTEALNALSQMDAATSMPALKRVLDRKDDCSAQLRRSAVFMLGRRSDTESANLLISVAKSDPNIDVRIAAINYLSRLPGDAGLATLEDLLKNDQDERIQRAAVRALNSSDNVHARTSMRALIDRKDAPMNLRIEAINSFGSDRTTNDDAAYLRALYPKADNEQMKDAILSAVSRIGGADNDQFVLAIAKNPNESSRIRSSALSRLSRSPTVTTADLSKIYDAADTYDVRARIVQIFSSRKDPESADKLIDIAKTSTVPQIKKEALNALMRRNDPRATQLFMDILDGKKP